jgi:hypothetical protein
MLLIVVKPFVVVGPEFEGQRVNPSNMVFRDMLSGTWPGILSLCMCHCHCVRCHWWRCLYPNCWCCICLVAVAWGFVDVRDVARYEAIGDVGL